MKQLPLFLFIILFTNAFSQDIIVDNSKTYSSSNQYAKFDRYTKHGGHGNYDIQSRDRITLPSNFPILGATFTLEAMTFTADTSIGLHQKVIGSEHWKGNYSYTSPNITFLNKNEIYFHIASKFIGEMLVCVRYIVQ